MEMGKSYYEFCIMVTLSPKKKDVIWVIVDRLTKSAHFISIRMDFTLDRLIELYVSEIVKLHGVCNTSNPYLLSEQGYRVLLEFTEPSQINQCPHARVVCAPNPCNSLTCKV
ncbi:integrase [Gossypium australe]|uniref:Integrase n=1 Tax=Gossypium australe TaxID=47621 RepID=A0A5B6W7T1_9ROSI|nr:integrase [Gossypium australe]